jgi:hypothetical protein
LLSLSPFDAWLLDSISSASADNQSSYSLHSAGAAAAEDKVCLFILTSNRHYHNHHGDSIHTHSTPYSLAKLRGQSWNITASAAAAVNPTNRFIP